MTMSSETKNLKCQVEIENTGGNPNNDIESSQTKREVCNSKSKAKQPVSPEQFQTKHIDRSQK